MSEKKYKLVSVTDKGGRFRPDIYGLVEKQHSLIGMLTNLDKVRRGLSLVFLYDDGSGQCLRTSALESVTQEGKRVIATTTNSVYTFELLQKSPFMKKEFLREYCLEHNYFTGGSSVQYETMFDMVEAGDKFSEREIALVICLCSPELFLDDVEQITEEIEELFTE